MHKNGFVVAEFCISDLDFFNGLFIVGKEQVKYVLLSGWSCDLLRKK